MFSISWVEFMALFLMIGCESGIGSGLFPVAPVGAGENMINNSTLAISKEMIFEIMFLGPRSNMTLFY